MYKDNWTQPWPMGSEIYPKAHENPRAFSCISGPIFLESSIQCPWGVGLHHEWPLIVILNAFHIFLYASCSVHTRVVLE